jgi:hypothetical protein
VQLGIHENIGADTPVLESGKAAPPPLSCCILYNLLLGKSAKSGIFVPGHKALQRTGETVSTSVPETTERQGSEQEAMLRKNVCDQSTLLVQYIWTGAG